MSENSSLPEHSPTKSSSLTPKNYSFSLLPDHIDMIDQMVKAQKALNPTVYISRSHIVKQAISQLYDREINGITQSASTNQQQGFEDAFYGSMRMP